MTSVLSIIEDAHVDRNRLTELRIRLGDVGTENLVCRTMEELAVLLAKVHTALIRGHLYEVHAAAGKIASKSDHVGLTTLGNVAKDVHDLAATDNAAALSACAARLSRVGEGSLIAVWGDENLSM